MGNEQSGNINTGIIGVDWSKNGGGVTLLGLRMGGGRNGFEAGPNVGIGAQVNGRGLHAGAGAKVTIGNKGIGTSTGAKSTAWDKKAGAAADAGVGWDGETEYNAYTSTNEEFESAQYNLDVAKIKCNKLEKRLRKCEDKLTSAESKLKSSEELLKEKNEVCNVITVRLKNSGIAKTVAVQEWTDLSMKSLLNSDKHSSQNSQANRQLTIENEKEIARLEKLLEDTQINLNEVRNDFEKNTEECNLAKDEFAECNGKLKNSQDHVNNCRKKCSDARSKLRNAENHRDGVNGAF